jgi:hypothetical protein
VTTCPRPDASSEDRPAALVSGVLVPGIRSHVRHHVACCAFFASADSACSTRLRQIA